MNLQNSEVTHRVLMQVDSAGKPPVLAQRLTRAFERARPVSFCVNGRQLACRVVAMGGYNDARSRYLHFALCRR